METRNIDKNKNLREMKKEIMNSIEHLSETMGDSAYESMYEIVESILNNISSNCKRTANEIVENDMFKETGAILSTGESQIEFLREIFCDIETAKGVCGSLISCMLRKLDKLEKENGELKANLTAQLGSWEQKDNTEAKEKEAEKSEKDKGTHYCFGQCNCYNNLRCTKNCHLLEECKKETRIRAKHNEA